MNTPKRPATRPRRSTTLAPDKTSSIKLNRSISDRWKAKRSARSTTKAAYLSTLPKEPWKRLLYRMHPKRVAQYWFSREGAIMALKITGIGIVAMFLLVIGMFAYFRKDLPKINDITGSKLGGSITYYDRTGQTVLWQDNDGVKRIPVEGNQMSNYMRNATVAVEDKSFYKHGAFDVRGLLRAGFNDAKGGSTQGGSTITQQLVKLNEQWTDNRTVTRKVKELILAVELEREYSKPDILTAYLNVAPYGGVEYGVESAARDYFGVSAKDLTLPEAAMLAAIPKAPSTYSPYGSTQFNSAASNTFDNVALKARMSYIFDQMASQHYITAKQAADAKKTDVLALVKPLQGKYDGIKAPYFVLAAKQELINKYGTDTVNLGGWKVVTTLDMNLQNKGEQLIASNYTNIQRRTAGLADDEANVTEDVHTGQIVEAVGGVDFNANNDYSKLNFASAQAISPGSSFKPYDYVTLLNNNNNVGAGSVMYDQDTALPATGYECTNHARPNSNGTGGNCLKDYDFLEPGPITLRYALGGSRNVPAVKSMLSAVPNDTSNQKVNSINKVIDTASAMMDNPYLQKQGQKTYNCYDQGTDVNAATKKDLIQCGASSAIGDGAYLHLDDHVNGLSTLARLGQAIPRTYLLKITNASNKTIYQWTQPKPSQPVKTDAAYILDDMASDPRASYLPGSCSDTSCTSLSSGGYKFQRYNGWVFAVKTGTTNYGFDGLMASWSNKYATASWVGNHTRNVDITSKVPSTTMELLTEPLTRGMMEYAHTDLKPDNWVKPTDIKTAPAFVLTKKIHYGDVEPSPSNDLYPSWYIGGSKTNTSATTDKVSGKSATSCTPDLAKNTITNGNAASWNIDQWNGGKPNVANGASSSGGPTVTLTDDVHNCSDSPPTVTLTAPGSCDVGGCDITVTASQGTHDLSGGNYKDAPAGTIAISIGGQTVQTFTMDQTGVYTNSFHYVPTSAGSQTVTATVVDSVLYSGTDTKTVDFTTSTPLAYGGSTTTGSSTTISWTGGTGPYTVYKGTTPVTGCSNVSGNSCTAVGQGVHNANNITIKDSSNPQQSVAANP